MFDKPTRKICIENTPDTGGLTRPIDTNIRPLHQCVLHAQNARTLIAERGPYIGIHNVTLRKSATLSTRTSHIALIRTACYNNLSYFELISFGKVCSFMNYVLFSPVGGTDPISFERDGGILHICRKYKPSCVLLYLSGEMLAHQSADDRYRKALRYLADEADFSLEIRTEERPNLTQVHLFDTFYQEFERLLRSLHAEFPKHGLLVNLSSGTPAMKSALAVLSTLMDFPVTMIQVASPNQRHNGRRDDPSEFDLDLYWECDLDRNPDTYQDRCQESKEENLRGKLQRQALKAHLSVYDYQAARTVGAQMGDLLQPDARMWLDAACLRANQEWRSIQPQELREKIIPKAYSDEERSIFEYLLGLQNRLNRGEFAKQCIAFHSCHQDSHCW